VYLIFLRTIVCKNKKNGRLDFMLDYDALQQIGSQLGLHENDQRGATEAQNGYGFGMLLG